MWPRDALYHERQSGGWCKVHSINACLGGPCYTPESLRKVSAEYSSVAYDSGVFEDGNDMMDHGTFGGALRFEGFAVERAASNKLMSTHVPGNLMDAFTSAMSSMGLPWHGGDRVKGFHPAALIYRPEHIFAFRKHGGQWYIVDSLSPGPLPTSSHTLPPIPRAQGNGVIIFFEVGSEAACVMYKVYRCMTVKMLSDMHFEDATGVKRWIKNCIMYRQNMGETEYSLSMALRIMGEAVTEDERNTISILCKRFGGVCLRISLIMDILLPCVLAVLEHPNACQREYSSRTGEHPLIPSWDEEAYLSAWVYEPSRDVEADLDQYLELDRHHLSP